MSAVDLVGLAPLMKLSSGEPQTVIGLLDGPVSANHPDLANEHISRVGDEPRTGCARIGSDACKHGTFVAGILSARRGSSAPAICPGCALLVRPIFKEPASVDGAVPSATARELAEAIVAAVDAGVRVLNLSAAFDQPSTRGESRLAEAIDYAARRSVIVVAAAGNQATLGSTVVTRHPWVIPVAGCDLRGRPLEQTNLGNAIGRRGLTAPGEGVASLGPEGEPLTLKGTSVAAPFVTGAIALLWSVFPGATAAEVKSAVTGAHGRRRSAVLPPLLDAWAAYGLMATASARR